MAITLEGLKSSWKKVMTDKSSDSRDIMYGIDLDDSYKEFVDAVNADERAAFASYLLESTVMAWVASDNPIISGKDEACYRVGFVEQMAELFAEYIDMDIQKLQSGVAASVAFLLDKYKLIDEK